MEREDVRLAVYDSFRRTGSPPSPSAVAQRLDVSVPAVEAELRSLDVERHLVLDGGGRIVMAHPFSAVPLGFSVMGSATLWWGGCCWDSFALGHLLPEEASVLVATRCPSCDAPGAWVVDREAPPVSGWVAHFLVPVARMWDDVVHTCGHQRLFCDEGCVESWLDRTGQERGYLMDVPTLWRLAAHWYDGRLDRGYVRREPSAAKEYFRSAGLSGPFWGLD